MLRILQIVKYGWVMAAVSEIRPGTVLDDELTLVERALERATVSSDGARLIDADGASVEVPEEIAALLQVVVRHLKAGHGVSVAALEAELTTTEAADLLSISRPHFIKQLEAGELDYRLVGSHRRIRLIDVLEYRDRQDGRAREALDEMTRQAEELGLYD